MAASEHSPLATPSCFHIGWQVGLFGDSPDFRNEWIWPEQAGFRRTTGCNLLSGVSTEVCESSRKVYEGVDCEKEFDGVLCSGTAGDGWMRTIGGRSR